MTSPKKNKDKDKDNDKDNYLFFLIRVTEDEAYIEEVVIIFILKSKQ